MQLLMRTVIMRCEFIYEFILILRLVLYVFNLVEYVFYILHIIIKRFLLNMFLGWAF